jgi:hypothetical protein
LIWHIKQNINRYVLISKNLVTVENRLRSCKTSNQVFILFYFCNHVTCLINDYALRLSHRELRDRYLNFFHVSFSLFCLFFCSFFFIFLVIFSLSRLSFSLSSLCFYSTFFVARPLIFIWNIDNKTSVCSALSSKTFVSFWPS